MFRRRLHLLIDEAGWLHDMLVQANEIEDGEKARKERCFSDYKAQLLYIEGMKAVLGENVK